MQQTTAGKRQSAWRKAAVLAALLCAALAAVLWWRQAQQLSPQQVDRLRMQALAGQEAQALPPLRHAAGKANVEAQRALAEILLRRPDTVQEGVHFAELAAGNGDAAAQFMLGKAYFDGSATATRLPDMARARHWLELAAEHRSAGAMYLLGLMHKSGYGGVADPVQAAQWFARAVQLGNADAMFMLGNAYHVGEGVARDEQQALRLYQAAAEKEQPLAVQTLAMAYRDGTLGLKQDKKEADQMLLEVAHILSEHH